MKHSVLSILFVMLSYVGYTQNKHQITHREINLHTNDSSIKTFILLDDKKIRLNEKTDYHWYYNNTIKINQGDYRGKLLDGKYQVATKSGNLITKGEFKKGKKSGKWKRWNNKGRLLSIYQWKNGFRHGTYQRIIEPELIEKGFFKKGLLHGKQLTYKSDTVFIKKRFKKGIEMIRQDKKSQIEEKKEEKKRPNNNKEKQKKWWQASGKEENDRRNLNSSNKWWQFWKKEGDSPKSIEGFNSKKIKKKQKND